MGGLMPSSIAPFGIPTTDHTFSAAADLPRSGMDRSDSARWAICHADPVDRETMMGCTRLDDAASLHARTVTAVGVMMIAIAGAQLARGDAPSAAAAKLWREARVQGGLIVHVGCTDGQPTAARRAARRFVVHGLTTDPATLPKSRTPLIAARQYGPVSTATFDGIHPPYADGLVNMFVVEQPDRAVTVKPPRVAILWQPDMPVVGRRSSPAVLKTIVERAGGVAIQVSADELSKLAETHQTQRIRMLVVPTGASFPESARQPLIEFLRGGGDLVTVGGYAFNNLLQRVDGRWVSQRQFLADQLRSATSAGLSLVSDGGFESSAGMPPVGTQPESPWHGSAAHCTITNEVSAEGKQCARVVLKATASADSATIYSYVPLKRGRTYQISAKLRAEQLTGSGIAYVAVYQLDAHGASTSFRDFAVLRQATDWTSFSYRFTTDARAVKVRIQGGLFRARGTVWIDDIRLHDITGCEFVPLNTSSGVPRDGLLVRPEQLGMFDPSYPLKRVAGIRRVADQLISNWQCRLTAHFRGWAASGVIGANDARWIPILEAVDRYSRPRGPVAALQVHYNGYYAGSWWAYFGVDNQDLFVDSSAPAANVLQDVMRFMFRKTCLRNLRTERRCYQVGDVLRAGRRGQSR